MKGTKKKQRQFAPRGRQADGESIQLVSDVLGSGPLQRDLLIEYLHLIQDRFKHLSASHLTALAGLLKISVVEVYEVASFYHHFDVIHEKQTPPPPLTIRVCDSITCQMMGADELINRLESDGNSNIRIQRVPCVGRCDKAPVAVVGKNPVETATPESINTVVDAGDYEAPLPQHASNTSAYDFVKQLYNRLDDNSRERIISQLEASNLRGLGGAGFPVGQ